MAKLLFVDDNPELVSLHADYLRAHGHLVATAGNGDEAMDLLDTTAFDVLITDVVMPEKEGIETIFEVRKRFPTLPIIAVSGGGHIGAHDYLTIARTMGARSTLAKPLAPSILLAEIERLLAPEA